MRLAIGKTLESGKVEVIDTARQPVRLGRDVFSQGRLSPEIIESSVEAFREFSKTIRRHEVHQTAAVATSAVREAANGRELTDRVRDETGIEIDVISGIQEARLVHLAVSQKLDMERGEALLVDIGGGSVEVVLTSDGLLIDSRSYDVGTVRMLQVLSDKRRGKDRFAHVVEEVCNDVRGWVTGIVGHNLIGRMVGTGGNVEAIGDITGRRAGEEGHVLRQHQRHRPDPFDSGGPQRAAAAARAQTQAGPGRRYISRHRRSPGHDECRLDQHPHHSQGWTKGGPAGRYRDAAGGRGGRRNGRSSVTAPRFVI